VTALKQDGTGRRAANMFVQALNDWVDQKAVRQAELALQDDALSLSELEKIIL